MSEPISIRDLIILLKNCKPDATVSMNFPGYPTPTEVQSWRGVYARPALGYRSAYPGMTVAELIAELEKATNGRTYTGWKGGDFSYSQDMLLHIANPGDAEDFVITGLRDKGWHVVLTFEEMEGRWDV